MYIASVWEHSLIKGTNCNLHFRYRDTGPGTVVLCNVYTALGLATVCAGSKKTVARVLSSKLI